MRISRTLPTLISLLLSTSNIAHTKPYPRDSLLSSDNSLEARQQCANPCGWEGQYCCSSDETCYTSGNVAGCSAGIAQVATQAVGDGNYLLYTTTYTTADLKTITSTWSVYQTPNAQSPGPGTPTVTGGGVVATDSPCAAGQDFCGGWLCCKSDQVCAAYGQCAPKSNTAAIRPTSNTVETLTSTAAATTTEGFSTPVTSDGATVTEEPSSGGLSGGAIAGIVIGVLVGLFLLFLLLACLCCKGLIDGLLALFGCGKKRRTEETYIATHHSHHSGSRPPPRRTWFGMAGPSRPAQPKKEGLGFMKVAGILGGLAVILGLKRRHDRKDEKSSYGSVTSYSYTDSDYTSASSASSDRRTRTTRHSRR